MVLILGWGTAGVAGELPPQPYWVEVYTPTVNSLKVVWQYSQSSATPPTGFIIERRPQDNPTFTQVATLDVRKSYVDKNLPAEKCFYYRVIAVNSAGTRTSEEKMGCTFHSMTPPAAPSHFKAGNITPYSFDLTWKDNADNETKYELAISSSAHSGALIKELPANTTHYTYQTIAPEATHWISLQAMSRGGVSAPVAPTPDPVYTAPLPPLNLKAEAMGRDVIGLSWTSQAKYAKTVKIESRSPGEAWRQIVTLENGETSYSHKALGTGTTHRYRVRMSLKESDSAYSNEASATTFPPHPMNLRAVVSSPTKVDLTWNISSGAQQVKVLYVKDQDERKLARPSAHSITVPGNITVASVTLPQPGRYRFTVTALSGGVESEPSNEVAVDTREEVTLSIMLIGHNWTGDCPNNGIQALEAMVTASAPVNIKWQLVKNGVLQWPIGGKLLTAGQNHWVINTPALNSATTTYLVRILEPVQKDSNTVPVCITCRNKTGLTPKPTATYPPAVIQPSGSNKAPIKRK
ncbi:MAG: fibronectin type III domain-containing protein [Deltaproteobacteria bacterium]|nr:fibronectin type III domain-containing protein [Deltaproteobacteria bacterium]